jgi:predicted alpha-1,2-mannosidase
MQIRPIVAACLACCWVLPLFAQPTKAGFDPIPFVDPFIGTDAHGHTFPGATCPFGMVQLSPDTRLEGWDGCSGYHYSDKSIYGFSHTHLSGTGVPDYCDLLLMPYMGRAPLDPEEYASPFQKTNEHAEPGYYKVLLDKPNVLAELTATPRAGIHRYTFPAEATYSHILIDLRHRDKVVKSSLTIVNDRTLMGYRISTGWAPEQRVYFAIRFSQPFIIGKVRDTRTSPLVGMQSATGTDVVCTVDFANTGAQPLVVTVGISGVSAEGALQNLQEEANHFDFDRYRNAARAAWLKSLGRIEVSGGTDAQKRVFYTALYHTMVAPNLFSDVDGHYRGHDGEAHLDQAHSTYTVFSLWDTYRACKPLYTLLEPARMNDFIQSFLHQYEQSGLLPVWELAGNETNCMIGYHSVPVIADAWRKGIRGYDGQLALKAMIASAEQAKWGIDHYRKYGYVPADKEGESVSKTLEYAYDDWCIAQMAKMQGNDAVYKTFMQRAQNWKNLFDPTSGFFRGKANASWQKPFDPNEVNFNFTEANAWQYRFAVPHDMSTLMDWMGGPDAFAKALDKLFTAPSKTTGREQADITGLIGQYAHGNEPSHHMAYLYNYAGQPWKTQQRVRQIMDELYTDKPDGLCGNEDVGQMSAWLVFSALGFYPVAPASNVYIVGTPWFERTVWHMDNGKTLEITAPGVSRKRFYVDNIQYNGINWVKSYLQHDMLARGGQLRFDLSDKPTRWAADTINWPVYAIVDELITPVPFVQEGERVFRDKQRIQLGCADKKADIRYTLDGSDPATDSALIYTQPFDITEKTHLRMLARLNGKTSPEAVADFLPLRNDMKVQRYKHPYTSPYTGGGNECLVDQLRGGPEFRSGGWQGFQGVNLDVVIDRGSLKPLQQVSVGFLQDENAWIFYPKALEVEISDDGVHFTPLGRVDNTVSTTQTGVLLQDLSVSGAGKSARYVRVLGIGLGNCPPEHKGAGNPCWVFSDEIAID